MRAMYSDVTTEYLALRRGAGIVHAHEIVWVSGPDSISFLDGLLSQSIEPMAPGDVAPSLLLSPQGKLRAPLWLLRDTDGVGLLSDIGSGSIVSQDLQRFKIRVDATISGVASAVLDVWGPESPAVVERLGFAIPDGWVRGDNGWVAKVPFRGGGDLPRFVIGDLDQERLVAAGAIPTGALAVTAARIEQGEPVNLVDVDEKTIPAEAHLVDGAVDFDKGCYLGQELVARIDSRGHVNRILRGLTISSNVVPPKGAEVVAGDAPVGRITSVAESLDLRAPVALGLLRKEVEPGDGVSLRWDGGSVAATVTVLPML